MKEEKLIETSIKLDNGVFFKIRHNMPIMGNINSIEAALASWEARTDEYTVESFVNYINSKGLYKAEVA